MSNSKAPVTIQSLKTGLNILEFLGTVKKPLKFKKIKI